MKERTIVLTVLMALLFVGCAKPTFNRNNKQILFVEGKPFRIPIGSNWARFFMHPEEHKETLKEYRKQGLKCRNGDMMWIEHYADKERIKLLDAGKSQYPYVGKLVQDGKIGCASPMSNQEYNFYREKELQNERDRKARSRSQGKAIQDAANGWADAHKNVSYIPATNPNVNVHHSGTINQNVNVYTPYQATSYR